MLEVTMNYAPNTIERMLHIVQDNMEADPRLQIVSNLLDELLLRGVIDTITPGGIVDNEIEKGFC